MMLHFSKLATPTANKHPLLCYIYVPRQRYLRGFTVLYRHWNYFLPMLSVAMDGNRWHEWVLTILSFKSMPAKKAPPKLFWPVFPNENCLINLSTEAFCVRVNTLHRIGLKQQSPRNIYPLTPFKTKSLGLSLPVAWQHIQLSVPKSI